jgi:Rps23 Pro-64 3,4-dihydroxylase Tpa1-like proline 4-hydroxylase
MFASALKDNSLLAQARRLIQSTGRVHLPQALEESKAGDILSNLRRADWRLAIGGLRGTYNFRPSDIAALDVSAQSRFVDAAYAHASGEFQFMFDSFRISDEVDAGRLVEGMLADFYRELNSKEGIAFLRALTGDDNVRYADAQATRYRPGHFLTTHTDQHDSKGRLYAYVLNLTPSWLPDWGGLLQFHADDGHIAEAYTPRWNALNVFKVPRKHAVSFVAPFAAAHRLSITGWLRSEHPGNTMSAAAA